MLDADANTFRRTQSIAIANGAIGSHAAAAKDARQDFRDLANKIMQRIKPDDA